MFDQLVKTLLIWMVIATVFAFSASYVIKTFVIPGMGAATSVYNTDRHDDRVAGN